MPLNTQPYGMSLVDWVPTPSAPLFSIPDYSEMVHESHEWLHLIYGNIEEELPLDMPIPLGKII